MTDAELHAHLDALVESRRLPNSRQVAALGAGVREVSDAYNAAEFPVRFFGARLAARLLFFLPRDQAKVAAALRDVPLPASWFEQGPPLRVLDVGAGVGASTLGAVNGLRARGVTRAIEAVMTETDRPSLAVATEVLSIVPGLAARAAEDPGWPEGPFDLVVLGQVLVEVAAGKHEADGDRLAAAVIATAMTRLGPEGRLVVVEPALLETSRRLQRIREAVVAKGAHIVAPCTHAEVCPLLAGPRDWCHDDEDIDLPQWLHPIARAAGLRWQGLTFSRLVLAREPVRTPALRVVAPIRDSRGRKERQACGRFADGTTLRWIDRLEKHATDANDDFAGLTRGSGFSMEPEGLRVGADGVVVVFDPVVT